MSLERSLATTTFGQSSGTITGSFPISVTGNGRWTGGTLAGNSDPSASTLVLSANTTFEMSNNLDLAGRVIQNNGTIEVKGNSIIAASNGGVLNNLSQGKFVKLADPNMATSVEINGSGAFFNYGLVKAEGTTSLAFKITACSSRRQWGRRLRPRTPGWTTPSTAMRMPAVTRLSSRWPRGKAPRTSTRDL